MDLFYIHSEFYIYSERSRFMKKRFSEEKTSRLTIMLSRTQDTSSRTNKKSLKNALKTTLCKNLNLWIAYPSKSSLKKPTLSDKSHPSKGGFFIKSLSTKKGPYSYCATPKKRYKIHHASRPVSFSAFVHDPFSRASRHDYSADNQHVRGCDSYRITTPSR